MTEDPDLVSAENGIKKRVVVPDPPALSTKLDLEATFGETRNVPRLVDDNMIVAPRDLSAPTVALISSFRSSPQFVSTESSEARAETNRALWR